MDSAALPLLTSPPAETFSSSPAPDWSTLTGDYLCPLCDYNLRGLSTPRCPECGHAFEWRYILDPQLATHRWLFEHQRRRKIRSFIRTFAASFIPLWFWRNVKPTHHPVPKRLFLYWLITIFPLLLIPIIGLAGVAWNLAPQMSYERARNQSYIQSNPTDPWVLQITKKFGSASAYLDSANPRPMSLAFARLTWDRFRNVEHSYFYIHPKLVVRFGVAAPAAVALALWGLISFPVLMIFVATMKRARISRIHIARCVVYSCDWAWLALPLVLLLPPEMRTPHWLDPYSAGIGNSGCIVLIVALVAGGLVTFRLGCAYRCYLKFPHAFAVAIATQLIVVLAVYIVELNW